MSHLQGATPPLKMLRSDRKFSGHQVPGGPAAPLARRPLALSRCTGLSKSKWFAVGIDFFFYIYALLKATTFQTTNKQSAPM